MQTQCHLFSVEKVGNTIHICIYSYLYSVETVVLQLLVWMLWALHDQSSRDFWHYTRKE